MIDYDALLQPDRGQPATSLILVREAGHSEFVEGLPQSQRNLAQAQRFTGKTGDVLVLPGNEDMRFAIGAPETLGVWDLASAVGRLPEGCYRLEGEQPGMATLGWLLAQYRFERYKKADDTRHRILLTPDLAAREEIVRMAEATALVRDMVNTPAADMGPGEIEAAAERIAKSCDAEFEVFRGDVLANGYPLIDAVGKAAEKAHAPRLIELIWGNPDHPRIAIIGKGVCFDSGGLNIKPGSGMRQMKKDMGGAAHALALAKLVIAARLPVRLHLLLPAVENAIAGNAFRPGDIVKSRAGLTVEIDNTDAEGRLVLADALTRAGESTPELIVDFATLTGAARVALGPDLPAMFSNDDQVASDLEAASTVQQDPVWRLPLWSGYDEMLNSDIADIVNSAEGGMAGAITAALFLRRFVPEGAYWAHFDTFAWRSKSRPGRPKGGDALGMRAAYVMLKARYPAA